ncbi:glycosyl transferase family 1 [Vibrio sp. UCD-FRSSP16_10]|uniref:glycosyltransferase family 4 protein n=1 Tax=unclassified Vibrio TaxID=2614977 RepID=UPI000800AD7C|nr:MULTISPECIES: glycosyltransferase family 4 protein [unclassified Vibrio]OBT10100.1 glycosyl transferase family 1 [Vibrio sp. UCD-FRSSP16_30]OBT18890.1 glycosyl transferase family 1 [Vibrio sp. UCD-FRSSP16_10]
MKILVCSSYIGPINTVRPEAETFIAMANLGHTVTIMTQANAEYAQICSKNGIKIIDNYPSKKICKKTISLLHAELKDGDYDICYAFDSKTIPNAAFASIGTKVKMVTYRGTTGGLYRHDPTAYLTHLHPRVNAIICNSDAVRKDIQSRVWGSKVAVKKIYKGHKSSWYQTIATPRSEFKINEDDLVGICACNVRPSKGISVLLRSLEQVTQENFHLLLAGNGFEKHATEIKNSWMASRIHLLGQRNDIPNLMKMADFQIQPSVSGEGFSRAIIEAMAVGTPSIVTTTGGGPEQVENDISGYVVEAGNSEELGIAINKLLIKPNLIATMGHEATKRVDTLFSNNTTVSEHLEFFKKISEQK